MSKINRRTFLKMLACAAVVPFIPQPLKLFSGATPPVFESGQCLEFESWSRLILVPPSIMLHSREGASRSWQFEMFLDEMLSRNFAIITYQEWRRRAAENTLPSKTAIVTIDDITALDNQQAWPVFQRMHTALNERGISGVFAVNTYIDRPHNQEAWDIMAEWVRQGAELATHSDTHATLNNQYSRPNAEINYYNEIARSAEFIEHTMFSRGVDYRTETFITPYGHGYDYHSGTIHPGIVSACNACNIRQVVGIGMGRMPYKIQDILSLDEPIYMGRSEPTELSIQPYNIETTVRILEAWYKNNQRLLDQYESSSYEFGDLCPT